MYGWMWAHPGKKLLFMGNEFAQLSEWSHDHGMDWHLLDVPGHAGVQQVIRDLGTRYRDIPALWEKDTSSDGFRWIDAGNGDQNVLSFVRFDNHGHPGVACIANLSPTVHYEFRVGLPLGGEWEEILNTDSVHYGGSGQGNMGKVMADGPPWHGYEQSAAMVLPPLATVWLSPK
jgi:1,4-alpha-glucan branching enzyme